MITVDMTRKELQDALRFQLELEHAVKAYAKAGYHTSADREDWQKYREARLKLLKQKQHVSYLHKLLLGYIR